jgi:two-component system chemotaxis response regulator CheB
MMQRIRVLVVDDSAAMRGLIGALLRRDPTIEVVGEAADPLEARQAIKDLQPDVVTLDVEMPKMNGLEFLERLMRLRPTPVIMISNLTQRGAQETIRALEIGAIDCMAKPAPGNLGSLEQLPSRVKMAAKAKLSQAGTSGAAAAAPARTNDGYRPGRRMVAIGSSTGGVEALSAVLAHFPANCPPTVIAQHMPESFLASLAMRLDKRFAPEIAIAYDGAPLVPGRVYFAPGGRKHIEIMEGSPRKCRIREDEPINGYCPSVDLLFNSVRSAEPANALGVILTGMGRDGAEGLLAMRRAGAATLGQDESTSLIYGMPKAAFEMGAVERQVPLPRIGAEILNLTQIKQEGMS